MFAADGTRLGFIQSDELRTPVAWSEIPADLKNATVAIEDQRFYKNDGVDLTGIFRAAVKDLAARRSAAGRLDDHDAADAQPLPRRRPAHAQAEDHRGRSWRSNTTKHHSKHSILTSYLNSVPYGTVGGQTAIGVQAAARIFFDKPVSQLDLEQSALLAGLPQAPSEYNPFLVPRRRQRTAQRGAREDGRTALHHQRAGAGRRGARRWRCTTATTTPNAKSSFFFEYVRQQLIERYGAQDRRAGRAEGLHDDRPAHAAAGAQSDRRSARRARRPGRRRSSRSNPHNGYIEAMAESESYEQSQYNLAADGHRQPGSTFKAIDLADALSRGIDPNTHLLPLAHAVAGLAARLPELRSQDVRGHLAEQVDQPRAGDAHLRQHRLRPAGRRPGRGNDHRRWPTRWASRRTCSSNPAEALGGLELGVTPLEMADVYATLADGGYRNTPIAITKVVFPDGHVDDNWGTPHRVKVLSEAVTAEETSILDENVQDGTATRSAIDCPTAAKTGTTSELIDAWLDGYTPDYSTVVWMGYPNERVPMTDVHGEPQQGGYLPAEIWHDYMAAVTEGQPCVEFPAVQEALSYQPFFGKYASTGLALAAQESGAARTEHSAKPAPPPAPELSTPARTDRTRREPPARAARRTGTAAPPPRNPARRPRSTPPKNRATSRPAARVGGPG